MHHSDGEYEEHTNNSLIRKNLETIWIIFVRSSILLEVGVTVSRPLEFSHQHLPTQTLC